MQTRLLACIAGGFIGVSLTSVVTGSLGIPPIVAYSGCTLAGIAVGYCVSILVHVFTAET